MQMSRFSFLILATLGLASSVASASHTKGDPLPPATLNKLIQLNADANAALMRGDMKRYVELLPLADDFTLMSPMGGQPGRAPYSPERIEEIGRFFKNGTFDQQLVQAYASRDMVVLATIERAHVAVGQLPPQEWLLRVTVVFRRAGSRWELVHRHADPLVKGISLEQSAALTLGAGDGPVASRKR